MVAAWRSVVKAACRGGVAWRHRCPRRVLAEKSMREGGGAKRGCFGISGMLTASKIVAARWLRHRGVKSCGAHHQEAGALISEGAEGITAQTCQRAYAAAPLGIAPIFSSRHINAGIMKKEREREIGV